MPQTKRRVICRVVKDVPQKELTPLIYEYANPTVTLCPDEYNGYNEAGKTYTRYFVNHGRGQYVDGDVYTNTLEGFWGLLKRGIFGTYHHLSRKHLQLYVNEFCFRYNTRKISDFSRFNLLLRNINYRLTYEQVIAA